MTGMSKPLDANDLVRITKLDPPLALTAEHNMELIRALGDGDFGCLISALEHTLVKVKALRQSRVLQ